MNPPIESSAPETSGRESSGPELAGLEPADETAPRQRKRLRLAIHKFASCDGCQLSLLDCEDELVSVLGAVEIAYFVEATRAFDAGPYDLSLVEGSITTPGDAERIRRVRALSRYVVTIGACATAGGIQALRNARDVSALAAAVYPRPEFLNVLETSTPIADHIRVDYELRGCPIDKGQLLEVLGAFLAGRRPQIPRHSVCMDCKAAGVVCVMVAHGTPCMGPVTHGGCGVLCPRVARGCYGCFGPMEAPRTEPLHAWWTQSLHVPSDDVARAYRTFNVGHPVFAAAAAHADTEEGA